jgi:serine/threonine-protein kinase
MSIAFGRYELLKKLASGGMGQVFLARRKGVGFEKLVVLKRILPHLVEDDDFLTMFLDEARIAARLNHPNIVQIFDVEAEVGQHLVVMEYVPGEDVRRLEKKARAAGQPLPLGAVLRIVADAAAGLDHAHKARDEQGQPLHIVHRDISPQNILVGFDGAVKLIDFGVAKAAGRAQQTDTGVLKGKFPYMSPEQADGLDVDARSDVFALGIVLWELLCDQRLFKGESDPMSQRLVRACQVPPPSRVLSLVPPALDAIVLKALAKNPDDRFPDAQAMREQIEQYCLEAHVPASSAHLASYLKKLYAERIAELADPSKLDELDVGTELEGFGARRKATPPPGRGVRRGPSSPGAGRDPEADVSTRKGVTEPVVRFVRVPPLKRSRAPLFATAGVLALGAAGVAAWLSLRGAPQAAPTATPVPQVQAPPQGASPALALKVETEPPGAAVEIAGVPRGMTPLDVSLERASLPALLKVSREGFELVQTTLTADAGPTLSLQLKKKREAAKKQLEIKTGR